MKNDARAGSAHRVTERNGAAVHVELFFIEGTQGTVKAELFAAILLVPPRLEAAEHLGGERLVDLPVVEVVEPKAVALEDRRGGMHRAQAHLRGVEAGPLRVENSSDRIQFESG